MDIKCEKELSTSQIVSQLVKSPVDAVTNYFYYFMRKNESWEFVDTFAEMLKISRITKQRSRKSWEILEQLIKFRSMV